MAIADAVLFLGLVCAQLGGGQGVFVPPNGSPMFNVRYDNLSYHACAQQPNNKRLRAISRNFQNVSCDVTTEGGRWIVIGRRFTGLLNFHQSWHTYTFGFGDPSREFYLGHYLVNLMTSQNTYELRVDMVYKNRKYFAKYDLFSLSTDSDGFRLTVGRYVAGDAGDSLSYHNNKQFSTYDKDNNRDTYHTKCVEYARGPWWYAWCQRCSLFGQWKGEGYGKGVHWFTLTDFTSSLEFVEMKLRIKT